MRPYGEGKIGNNVLIGANLVILPNVSIGDDSVVAAGSAVIKDITEFSVIAGDSLRMIKRFDKLYKKQLERSKDIEKGE